MRAIYQFMKPSTYRGFLFHAYKNIDPQLNWYPISPYSVDTPYSTTGEKDGEVNDDAGYTAIPTPEKIRAAKFLQCDFNTPFWL